MEQQNYAATGWKVWVFCLLLVYPVPHTIAIRNLLLVGALVTLVVHLFRQVEFRALIMQTIRLNRVFLLLLTILTLWMPLQISFWGIQQDISFGLWKGDWLESLLIGVVGFLAVSYISLRRGKEVLPDFFQVILWALFFHLIVMLVFQFSVWMGFGDLSLLIRNVYGETGLGTELGKLILGRVPFAGRDYHSTLLVMAMAVLFPAIISYIIWKKPLLKGRKQILFLLAVGLLSTVAVLTRNSMIVVMFLMFLALSIVVYRLGWLKTVSGFMAAGISFLILVFFLFATVKSDPRWIKLSQAYEIAQDTETTLNWLDPVAYPFPEVETEEERIDGSAYLRIAWATVALEGIRNNPMGVGYGYKAFGWYVNQSRNVQTGLESSHSGILDFTLANGFPGLFLLLITTAWLLWWGWNAGAVGLLLVFHVSSYFVRIVLDGHFSGFRLEMFTLILGMILAWISLQILDKEKA